MTGYMVSSFLLKYKRLKNKTKFCDYDCDSSDNRCDNSYLLDSCYNNNNSENKSYSTKINEGLIKK
jgi:hypothetical protein